MIRKHVVVDWWVDNPEFLNHAEPFRRVLKKALSVAGFNSVGEKFHDFKPKGFTGFILLSESHVSVHSWWEEELITLDVFSCRPDGLDRFIDLIRREIKPKAEEIREIPRGVAFQSDKSGVRY
jgi:S-adenosylmethionine decarboxylase proenzyme